jgi:hypothetical protein
MREWSTESRGVCLAVDGFAGELQDMYEWRFYTVGCAVEKIARMLYRLESSKILLPVFDAKKFRCSHHYRRYNLRTRCQNRVSSTLQTCHSHET